VLSEPYLCLARAGHPLRAGGGSVAELMLWPHVGVRGEGRSADPLTGALLAHGLEHKLVATFPYQAAAADLLAATDAIMLLPEAAALEAARDPRLAASAAPDGLPRFEQWLAWHNRSHRDPAIGWLVEMLAAGCARPERDVAFAIPLAAE
jgi:DNA-binding transcriptional LysR family regulator